MAVVKPRFLMELLMMNTALLLSGLEGIRLYSRVDDDVILPCKSMADPNCSSTSWSFERLGPPLHVVTGGKIMAEKAERMRVMSDCSLEVKRITAEDAGFYTCKQHCSDEQEDTGKVAHVLLSVVFISSSTLATDLKPYNTLTLNCSLQFFSALACQSLAHTGVIVSWVDETGATLQGERYQFSGTSHCDVTLIVTLQEEDNNRKWRCQLTDKGEVKTFIDFRSSFTSTFAVQSPESFSHYSTPPETGYTVHNAISRIVLCVTLPLLVLIGAVHIRRKQQQADNSSGVEVQVVN
ncbi:hypothetical protein DPEC_G00243450 [Dallia pectoralis]|uniref:Uncharacterized protein n=1 Tax=Dallia pectoralis TaxID=75939 RepID=A0ACC2FVF2_DALPE|nr:hypothetical protein DPEC_G00243450 [Dallia pectoralis]